MTFAVLALLFLSRTVIMTVSVCLLSVVEIQTAPPCWMKRTLKKALCCIHRGMVLWAPRGVPNAAHSAADWTAPLQALPSEEGYLVRKTQLHST